MADRPCKQAAIEQISTGQAGAEVNRDLESLFRAVNRLIRCVSKISDYIDGQTGNGFDAGNGTGTGGGSVNDPPGSGATAGPEFMNESGGSDITLGDFMDGVVYYNPSGNINVTLGAAAYGTTLWVVHSGTANTITVKNAAGTTLATLSAGQRSWHIPMPNTSGVIVYGVTQVFGDDGRILMFADVQFDVSSHGPVVKDQTDGNKYRIRTNMGLVNTVVVP